MKLSRWMRSRTLVPAIAVCLLALLPLSLYLTGGKASAQCGTSTSSCKNCHEVQGNDPVGNIGEWHTAHAFGDFCEFCHAGTVEAKTQDEAHVGMVAPLGDVKASCQSCHPQDFQDKAQVYATALGVTLGAGGSGGASAGGGGAVGGDTQASGGSGGGEAAGNAGTAEGAGAAENATTDAAAAASVAAAPSGELVDYNALYAAGLEPEQTFTTGDIVLLGLIGLLLIAFFLAAWKLEHWGDRLLHWWQHNMVAQPPVALQGSAATAAGMALPAPARSGPAAPPRSLDAAVPPMVVAPAELEELYRRRPDLRGAMPYLLNADAKTLQALAVVLAQPQAGDVLLRLSALDLSFVSALQSLAPADQALLLALAQRRNA